jgi:hypothetical protein
LIVGEEGSKMNVKRQLVAAVMVVIVALMGVATPCTAKDLLPVTSEVAAIAAAKSAWESIRDKSNLPVYRNEEAKRFEPYSATLKDGVWTVRGTIPAGYHGQTLVTTVRQDNGVVLVQVVQIN